MANTLIAIMKMSPYFGDNDLALLPIFGSILCYFGTDENLFVKIERGCVRRWLKVDALIQFVLQVDYVYSSDAGSGESL